MANEEYTTPKLMDFLREAPNQGLLNPAVARSRANAIEQLFVELTLEEKKDIRRINVDKIAERLHTIQGSTIRAEVMTLYKTRVSEALIDYLAWLKNPTTFATISGHTQRRGIQAFSSDANSAEETRELESIALATSERRKDYLSVPIRKDHSVYITNLPLDMSAEEAGRISRLVIALARPESEDASRAK